MTETPAEIVDLAEPADRVRRLRALVPGRQVAGEIAEALGATRSAVAAGPTRLTAHARRRCRGDRKTTGCAIERGYVDKGYRGHNAANPRRIFISARPRLAPPSDVRSKRVRRQ